MLKMKTFSSIFIALLAGSCNAHSWIEQMSLVGDNGSFTGAYGYPRGYVARTDPGFNGFSNLWLIPDAPTGRTRADSSDYLCHPAQRTVNQSVNYPVLKAAPGSVIALKYLENGHVSLPLNQKGKPEKGGTVFVYGTTKPRNDEKLIEVLQWTADGTGGDGRGALIATNNFDDDRCYQINGGTISTQRQEQFPDPNPGQPGSRNEQWCETDIVLPSSLNTGTLTLYWVWDWPTAPGQDPTYPTGKDEYYTTCADVNVQAQAASAPISNKLVQQDPQPNAVAGYKSRTANVKVPQALGPIVGSPSNNASPVIPSTPGLTGFLRPVVSAGIPPSASTALSLTPARSAVVTGQPGNTAQVLTALVTVVATLQPGQAGVVIQGQHIVTFVNPDFNAALATATPNPVERMQNHARARDI